MNNINTLDKIGLRLVCSIILMISISKASFEVHKNIITVYPTENNSILKNPGKGFVFYSGHAINDESVTNSIWSIASIGFLRIDWKLLEPTEGNYNWGLIDNSIQTCTNKGIKFALGIMPVCINSDISYSQSTPNWVFDAGAKYTVETLNNDRVNLKVPVWNDLTYIAKFKDMITAINNRYGNDSRFAFMDVGSYGNWGEFHLRSLPHSVALTDFQLHKLVDIYKDCTMQLFLANNSSVISSINVYAQNTYRIGVRRNGCVNPFSPNEHLSLLYSYDKSPAVAEWWYQYSTMRDNGMWSKLLFERVIREGKPSYMALSQLDESTFYTEQKNLVDRWVNRLGYWLKLTEASYSANLGNGSIGTLKFRVKNDGVAPLYPNKSNIGYVKVALMDSKNNILDAKVLLGINPFNWKPGVYTNESTKFYFNYNRKGVKIAIGVFTDKSLAYPDIKLGNNSGLANAWYVLSDMPKIDGIKISDNKIYKASSTLADETYGYREARYAFDNNPNTKWVADTEGSASLEVDFGESKSFSKVYLKEDIPAITSYSIDYFDGIAWKTAYNGTTIGAVGTVISFSKVVGSKARLYITKHIGEANIAEFSVLK
ncbi:discoidin domain-containing protein [Clostridium sp. WILCCON 0269]|uniref:Discoidin domain-containing protein n=1 Tax=Candidatus Clostridium eludens TaxID=3381663 RepID=A0ABW8SIF2_9CLOT